MKVVGTLNGDLILNLPQNSELTILITCFMIPAYALPLESLIFVSFQWSPESACGSVIWTSGRAYYMYVLRVQPSPMLLYTVSPSQLSDWSLFCVTRVTCPA